jgi:hypothetical protein
MAKEKQLTSEHEFFACRPTAKSFVNNVKSLPRALLAPAGSSDAQIPFFALPLSLGLALKKCLSDRIESALGCAAHEEIN